MATTTNFGWETPDDTDLVKDGALAIRTLGSAIDTSLVDLKGGTTGQVLSKTSNTDMDFTWVAQDDSNAIQNAIVDAKGDLITATAADTPARLAVGTNGQVLTADSTTASGLKWATSSSGGITLLSTTSTTTGGSYTISNISQDYLNLLIIWDGIGCTAGNKVQLSFASGTGYGGGSNSAGSAIRFEGESIKLLDNPVATGNCVSATIYNYTSSAAKTVRVSFVSPSTNGGGFLGGDTYTSPISAITVTSFSGSFTAGTLKIYGVK